MTEWLNWTELQCGRPGFDPWVSKIPWRKKWQPTPVLLPRKFHGWRSLVGYSPWGCKESDMAERLHSLLYECRFLAMRAWVVVHEISQARILEQVAVSFSRESSQLRGQADSSLLRFNQGSLLRSWSHPSSSSLAVNHHSSSAHWVALRALFPLIRLLPHVSSLLDHSILMVETMTNPLFSPTYIIPILCMWHIHVCCMHISF